MKKTILTFALLLGASSALKAQTSDKSLLIDQVGQQYEISNATIMFGEELQINSQGKVTRGNGNVIGYASKTGPYVPESPSLPYNGGAVAVLKGSIIEIN